MTDATDPILFARPEITDDDVDAVARVLRSGWITTGTESAGLEADLSAYLGGTEVVAVSSCTAALDIALAYLDLPPGSRVGVPAWTFVSTALAAVHNGLAPVLLDVDPDTLAVLARSQLRRFDASQARRRELLTRYRALLEPAGLRFVPGSPHPGSADHLAIVVLPEGVDRDEVVAAMSGAGIGTSVHFRPLHTFTWFAKNAEIGPGGLPVCDALQPRALSLPLHVNLSDADVERVADALLGAIGG